MCWTEANSQRIEDIDEPGLESVLIAARIQHVFPEKSPVSVCCERVRVSGGLLKDEPSTYKSMD